MYADQAGKKKIERGRRLGRDRKNRRWDKETFDDLPIDRQSIARQWHWEWLDREKMRMGYIRRGMPSLLIGCVYRLMDDPNWGARAAGRAGGRAYQEGSVAEGKMAAKDSIQKAQLIIGATRRADKKEREHIAAFGTPLLRHKLLDVG